MSKTPKKKTAQKPTPEKFKLSIDLVPGHSWGKNLRNILPPNRWAKIRARVLERGGGKCEICGSPDKLNCHEKWEYDSKTRIQKLVGLGMVCHMCHHVMHFARASQIAKRWDLDMDAVKAHFMKVNQCGLDVFDAHKAEAGKIWAQRSMRPWNIDYGEYSDVVAEVNKMREERAKKKK